MMIRSDDNALAIRDSLADGRLSVGQLSQDEAAIVLESFDADDRAGAAFTEQEIAIFIELADQVQRSHQTADAIAALNAALDKANERRSDAVNSAIGALNRSVSSDRQMAAHLGGIPKGRFRQQRERAATELEGILGSVGLSLDSISKDA